MMPKLPEPDEYLCFFDEGGMQDSNEMGYSKQSVRSIQEEAYRAGMAKCIDAMNATSQKLRAAVETDKDITAYGKALYSEISSCLESLVKEISAPEVK